MRFKAWIVTAMERLCSILDNTPGFYRSNKSWRSLRPHRRSQFGCGTLHLANRSAFLDEKWGTDVWRGSPP